ncbi:MAG TPA: ABC transporter permease [Candidatus Thermoplasmatota archaeon]|nr:ABC transporter permease [Candidatus Thermoplasmatota archaeon]
MRLLAFLGKDARLVLRNRPLLAALLLYPFLLALVLGAAFQEPPSTLDLAVVDLDKSGETIDVGGETIGVEDLLASAGGFARVQRPASEDAALRLLRAGDVDAVLVVPPGFIGDLQRFGGNATLRVIVDESDPVRAGVARNAVEGAVDAFVRSVVQKKIDDVVELLRLTAEGGQTTILFAPVDVLGIDGSIARLQEVRGSLANGSAEMRKVDEVVAFLEFARTFLGNSEQYLTTTAVPLSVQAEGLAAKPASLASIAIPGALVLGVFWTGALAAALLSARERETGADRRIAAAPHARLAQGASKAIVALLAALVPAGIVLVLGIGALGASVADPAMAVVALAIAALAAAALGGLAAALARSTGGAALLAVLALLPMLLLGGLFYPVAYMPAPARAVASVLPVTLATDALRGAMLRGSTLPELAAPLAALAGIAALLAGGIWLSGRRAP